MKGNIPVDSGFIYKVKLLSTLDETKSTRYLLAKNFDDVSQLIIEICKDNDYWVRSVKEIEFLDYVSGEIAEWFKNRTKED